MALALFALALSYAPAHAAGLRAGVGKADVTPQTGYYLGGWTRADRVAGGQHTRLHARALVLERGGRKVALVSLDLFMVPGGMVKHVGEALQARGFSEQNILISASHTHSGPGGYANFPTLNTAAPSLQTATDPFSFVRLLDPTPRTGSSTPSSPARSRRQSSVPIAIWARPLPAGAPGGSWA